MSLMHTTETRHAVATFHAEDIRGREVPVVVDEIRSADGHSHWTVTAAGIPVLFRDRDLSSIFDTPAEAIAAAARFAGHGFHEAPISFHPIEFYARVAEPIDL